MKLHGFASADTIQAADTVQGADAFREAAVSRGAGAVHGASVPSADAFCCTDAPCRQAVRIKGIVAVLALALALIAGFATGTLPGILSESVSPQLALAEESADADQSAASATTDAAFADADALPSFSASPSVDVNGGVPTFSDEELASQSFQDYAQLDSLGRCGTAFALVGSETMPTEPRGSIGMIKPSGWSTIRYDGIDGMYLFNRCHLIGYQLTGQNANERNLITGTRYLNTQGMEPFETQVADYVSSTGNHVLYRVTPVFVGDELVARGVHMEAESVEDGGAGISFNVYCFNVQPGIRIDYATGASELSEHAAEYGVSVFTGMQESGSADALAAAAADTGVAAGAEAEVRSEPEESGSSGQVTYVLNTNTKKFHRPGCSSVDQMKAKNRQDFYGTRDEVIAMGYVPCKRCNP